MQVVSDPRTILIYHPLLKYNCQCACVFRSEITLLYLPPSCTKLASAPASSNCRKVNYLEKTHTTYVQALSLYSACTTMNLELKIFCTPIRYLFATSLHSFIIFNKISPRLIHKYSPKILLCNYSEKNQM